MGKGWGAGTADYISHHAQHCGPHQTKKEVDPFTWIPRGPEEGRGRDRRLRRRLFTKFLVRCVVCVLLSCTVSLQPSVAFHETSIVRACENPVLCLKLDRFCLKPFVVKKKRGGGSAAPLVLCHQHHVDSKASCQPLISWPFSLIPLYFRAYRIVYHRVNCSDYLFKFIILIKSRL